MKKPLLFVLMFAMLLSLCACGGGNNDTPADDEATSTATEKPVEETITPEEENTETQKQTMDELLSTAIEIDGYTFFQEYDDNKVKHSSNYNEKACLVEGTIYEIETDHIVVTDSNLKVNIYLPTEEIVELQKDQYVEIVGIVENIGFEQNMSLVWVTVDFNTGYVSKSTYTKTGEYNSYHSADGTHPQGLCLKCVNDSGKTYFVELELTAEQSDTLTNGQEITVEGRLFVNDNDMPYSAYTKLIVDTIE